MFDDQETDIVYGMSMEHLTIWFILKYYVIMYFDYVFVMLKGNVFYFCTFCK